MQLGNLKWMALALAPFMAQASHDEEYVGRYAEIGGGITIPQDGDFTRNNSGFEAEYNDGGYGVIRLGHSWSGPFRFDVEGSYSNESPEDAGGDLDTLGLLVNLYADFMRTKTVSPYVGIGIGAVRLDAENFVGSGGLGLPISDEDVVLGGQVGAGLRIRLHPRLFASLDYRYFLTDDPTFDTSLGGEIEGEFAEHRIGAALGMKFDVASKAAPAPVDSDGDGVIDANDQCPNTPIGTVVTPVGCAVPVPVVVVEKDTDGDGVLDKNDRCPNTPRGTQVNSFGCALDDDRDGVANPYDRCPNTPRGERVDSVGCAIKQVRVLDGVNFEYNSAKLTATARRILDEEAAVMRRSPNFRVAVQGHTDSQGSDAYNQTLSEKRAASARDYLVQQGVNADRLSTRGFGESQPVASNATAEGRARNRRVELEVLGSYSK